MYIVVKDSLVWSVNGWQEDDPCYFDSKREVRLGCREGGRGSRHAYCVCSWTMGRHNLTPFYLFWTYNHSVA